MNKHHSTHCFWTFGTLEVVGAEHGWSDWGSCSVRKFLGFNTIRESSWSENSSFITRTACVHSLVSLVRLVWNGGLYQEEMAASFSPCLGLALFVLVSEVTSPSKHTWVFCWSLILMVHLWAFLVQPRLSVVKLARLSVAFLGKSVLLIYDVTVLFLLFCGCSGSHS